MSAATAPARLGALLLALAAAACGPYANVAQKLDVTARVAGDTWIAAAGTDRSEIRILLVGTPGTDGAVAFAFSSMQIPLSRGSTSVTLQGTWIEVGSAGATTLHVDHTYTLLDESNVGILNRRGAWRDDHRYAIALTVARAPGRLVVTGNPSIAGTYVPLAQALAQVGATSERDAACGFQVANLAILTSEIRIIGFGGPGMTQYGQPESYIGTVAGSVRVAMSGGLSGSTTTIQYGQFQDFGGVRVDGVQITTADAGGNGRMRGVVTYTFEPIGAEGAPLTPVTGTIDYGGAGNPADAIQIVDGNADGGVYVVTVGGATARVSPQTAPSPSVSGCLALP